MNEHFLAQATKYEPVIHQRICKTASCGILVPKADAWFGYQFEQTDAPSALVSEDTICVDFGKKMSLPVCSLYGRWHIKRWFDFY